MTGADFLLGEPLPFCPGCGHHLIARNTARALAHIGVAPLATVLVTDIGCHGIVDKFFRVHTVHGLHGRAAALGAGIAASLPQGKVVVFVGDGGASIGLQHLVECASRNFPLTVIVHNNMLYGMTGGQPSALTPCGFRTPAMPLGKEYPGYDLCRILAAAGAVYVSRINGAGDFTDGLVEALRVDGFSLVEVIEACPSYGLKHNPGSKPADIAKASGLEFGVWRGASRPAYRLKMERNRPSLLEPQPALTLSVPVESLLSGRFSLLLAGSAGGGVQQAAELLAQSAIQTGLFVTKKGTYPVTVGTGFSAAEIIISSAPIHFTGVSIPDAVVVVSDDGLAYAREVVSGMTQGIVVTDDSLVLPLTKARIVRRPFRKVAGPRNAALLALVFLLETTRLVPVNVLLETADGVGRIRGAVLREMLARLRVS
ncbi:MAG: thiamine pyrophosphate-dependent enzyme [candidate division WOR-3 bacterium]